MAGGGEISELAEAFREMTRKLEARHRYISAFAADVAHEFKSPLTSIRGAAELLAEERSRRPGRASTFPGEHRARCRAARPPWFRACSS